MEFKEFTNPEESDYDLKSLVENISNDEIEVSDIQRQFYELLIDLGMPEIDELIPFGITEKEYNCPTKQTLIKLKKYAENYKIEKNNKIM